MALDVSPGNLRDELDAAIKLRDRVLAHTEDLVRDYIGRFYDSQRTPSQSRPENHAFEFVSLMLPHLVYANPAVYVEPRRSVAAGMVAEGLEEYINTWISLNDFGVTNRNVVLDSFFAYGITITTLEDDIDYPPDPQTGVYRKRPVVTHLPYSRFFTDPTSSLSIPARFRGHLWVKDRSELEAMEDVEQEALKLLRDDEGKELLHEAGAGADRKRVVGYEIWVPDHELPEIAQLPPDERRQYHGTIFTLGVFDDPKGKDKKTPAYIRKPRPYYGPKWGPYTIYGLYPVPDSPYYLSPLAVSKEQSDDLNLHARVLARSARNMKTVQIVQASDNAMKHALKNAEHNDIIPAKQVNPQALLTVTTPGPTDEQYQYVATLRERLDRNSGINDAHRGNLDPKITATANAIADKALTARLDGLKQAVYENTARTLQTVGWLAFHSELVVAALGMSAERRFGVSDPHYVGGIGQDQQGLRWEDVVLKIEPYSMDRTDDVLMQAMASQTLAFIMQIPQIAVFPWIDIRAMLRFVENIQNYRAISKIVKMDVLEEWIQQQAQGQQQQPDFASITRLYRDAPLDVQRQIEQMLGMQPSQQPTTALPLMQLQQDNQQFAANLMLKGRQAAGGMRQQGRDMAMKGGMQGRGRMAG